MCVSVACDSGMKENLWLNLSTGHIGSGRRQWDGSGGTDGKYTLG
jgi:ubiquitin carboxyl-terminal hydrolase 5/13